MNKLLLNRKIYTEVVQGIIPAATRYVWIVTADIKNMHVESHGSFVPFLQILDELVQNKVRIRLVHAKEPGPRFRQDFDRFANLVHNELFERILCPRVHTKAVSVDGRYGFVGSANLTGAGLGSKHEDKRNFEAGFLFDETEALNRLNGWIDDLCFGRYCETCKRQEYCPDPIIDNF